MLPTVYEAEQILMESEKLNPGPWKKHSLVAGECAGKIAEKCDMYREKAYILGLLHDIGRRFGARHLGHVYDGYRFLKEAGYDEAAKICLTHSFPTKELSTYIGNFDIPAEQIRELEEALESCEYDDYDRLIQLCDAISMPEGPVDIKKRLNDVKLRYGHYPESKELKIYELRDLFEKKMGLSLAEVIFTQTM